MTIAEFQKKCFNEYIKSIPELPDPYIYPDGNPIRPVIPTKTELNSIMLIGAFPSARFERRNNLLIPIGDNLSPFGQEEYFDGSEVRKQASRLSLDENYFKQLGINADKIWITDIVKVYLFPEKHIKNCIKIAPEIKFKDTHKLFPKIAKASMIWLEMEIEICNPKLIITLGEIAARTITGDKFTTTEELLNGKVREVNLDKSYKISHLAHPEIIRLNKRWNTDTKLAIENLANEIKLHQYQI